MYWINYAIELGLWAATVTEGSDVMGKWADKGAIAKSFMKQLGKALISLNV